MKAKKCMNTLPSRVELVTESSMNNDGIHDSSDGLTMDHASDVSAVDHVSCSAEPRYDLRANTSARVNRCMYDDSQGVPTEGKNPLE